MLRQTLLSILLIFIATIANADERKTLFNDGWKFDGQNVTLPHDWSILHPFDRDAAPGNDGGYLPGGKGVYTKEFILNKRPKNKRIELYFEGVYENSEVYVNGKLAGGHPYGYVSFFVDITPYLVKDNNTIEVKVDNSQQKNCRWYSGSGIYRNVWLIETPYVHIADWGVGIQTPDLHTANISIEAENGSDKAKTVQVEADIDGITATKELRLLPHKSETVQLTISVPQAKPWSIETPNLYNAKISLKDKGKIIDSVEQPFGFRTISWSAKDGLRLNGKQIVLNGGCAHHDNGILGAAAYDRAEYRKVELLKKAGFNAVRTSHNPPSETFLKACDELGLLVIDEAFDGWRDAKNKYDYHLLFDKWATKDLASMVKRDRNHPSIFCWSIGNEIIERKKPQAVKDAHMLAQVCKSIDPTRPVTQALASWDSDWEIYDPLAAEHDIVGYNYMIHKAESDHQRVPNRVMMQTESYPKDAWQNYRMVKDHPYIIGDFVWTAIDYLGESGIGRWYYDGDVPGEHFQRPLFPWHAAYCGDIDLTGFRKPISHYRSILWNDNGEKLYIAVREPDGFKGKIKTTMWGTWPTFESWNWQGYEGKPIDVEVYSRYPKVRLYQDGKLIGEKETDKMMATFTLNYAPGKLVAEGVDGDKVVESKALETAGSVADLRLSADCSDIKADGQDLSFITIECVDANGIVVPVADNKLTVTTNGSVKLIALGNADIKDLDPYYDNTHHAWMGRALAVVRNNGNSGDASITVSAETSNGTISKTLVINSIQTHYEKNSIQER